MSTRLRSRGSATDSHFLGTEFSGTREEARRFGAYPGMEIRSVPIDIRTMSRFSDLQSITDDPTKSGTCKPCTHTRDYRVMINCPLADCKRVDGFTVDRLPWDGSWRSIAVVGGKLIGSHSLSAHYPSIAWPPNPNFSPVDWSAQVNSVGAGLDGCMTASTNILVEVVQLGQTLRMIKNPFGLLSKFRGSRKTIKSLVKETSNAWLEYRYGWRNLLYDITNVVKCWEKARKHMQYLMSTRGAWSPIGSSSSSEVSLPAPPFSVVAMSNVDQGYNITCSNLRCRRETHFSCRVLREESFRILTQMEYAMQNLGTKDIRGALWDLLPFSFVVDWFINLSNLTTMNSIYKLQSSRVRNLCFSTKTRFTADFLVQSYAMSMRGYITGTPQTMPNVLVRETYERNLGFPPVSLTDGIFGGFSVTHLMDGAALIAQRT